MVKPTPSAFFGWAASFFLVASSAFSADKIEEVPGLAVLFQEHNLRGTFVLLDLKTGRLAAHDAERAAKRFIPASTFKITNSIIGLETGAVKNVDEVLPYGGKPQPFPNWEHDMALREAIPLSAVPIYQELARRIGLARMNEWVTRLGYGNATIGNVVDQFWLTGPLEISAIEQAQFLARFTQGSLPIRPETLAAVNEITLIEKTGEFALHGKTGWCMSRDPDLGWWVGWVEREGRPIATFALNVDLPEESDGAKRVPFGKECLQTLGVLPPAGK